MSIVVLAGGTGGAKLARGMLDVAGDDLVVIANTGDDLEAYGGYVSPDPDLVSFSLLDRLDPRGWGLAGDTFEVMEGLREIGAEAWFSLGDRDLAYSIERRRRIDAGERLTQAQAAIGAGLGLRVPVLPMCDEPVRTRVRTAGAWHDFQAFMIQLGGAAADFDAVDGVDLVGIEAARMTPEVQEAIAGAEVIVVGPSNPVISI
ncbi:MAG: 2-phospho-L-lactate transferase, partial [Solirubrobacteraceae bacterium]|nr:2-phospho-L-lactate transferase [Solirubrobacteraceae bacterium]